MTTKKKKRKDYKFMQNYKKRDNNSSMKNSEKKQNKIDQQGFQWKRAGKTSLMWIMIVSVAIYLSGMFAEGSKKEPILQYSQYRGFLQNRQIADGTFVDKTFHGSLKTPQSIITDIGIKDNVTHFQVILPFIDQNVMDEWDEYGVDYSFKEENIDWTGYLLNMLPWFLIIAFWIFIMRRMQGGAGGMGNVFNFGKSRAKIWDNNMAKVTFDDVAGCVEAKEELKEVIDFLKHPKRFRKLGAKIPRGVLLLGPPGTGKTLLARAVAGQANVPFFSLSGADFVEMFVGVGASRVRDLFEQGKKESPCIIFIDELDAVGRQRGAGLGGGHDEREQTLNQLLVELDGFENNHNIIVMSATNRPDVLDSALLRPGRFDRHIIVDVPDVRGRIGILKVHAKNILLNKRKVNLETIAKSTPGMVGADLANIVNEAALLAARKRKKAVEMDDFEEAIDKVMMGVQRKSMILTEEEKKITAYHEAGHALVALRTKGADPVHKVTIIPRGRALGLTMQLPLDEKHGYSRKYIEGRLGIMMGGRAAEELVFNEMTTGAGNDLEEATKIARKMVCEWGMSDVLGPMTFGKKNEEIFLGREIQTHRDFSEVTARMIDEEVVRIVRKAQKAAKDFLKENESVLHRIAKELLEHETIDEKDLNRIMDGKKVIRRRAIRPKKKRKKVNIKSPVRSKNRPIINPEAAPA